MDVYFDCFSGISGDMVLGAFLDLGVPVMLLKENIASLPLTGFDIVTKKTIREGIVATNCLVTHSKTYKTRKYCEIIDLIEKSNLTFYTKQESIKIFDCIARAESKIHRCNLDQVHFHEVGAVDSIIDIVGSIICMEYLNIKNVLSSEIPLGAGFTKCSHGTLPIPSPATLEILKGIPIYGSQINNELVTPTGAGILASTAKSFGKIPRMIVEKIGYGCGKRKQTGNPNLLRIILGEMITLKKSTKNDSISIIESNIDDMNPEIYSFLIEKLFNLGALDVCFIPVTMKKSRPGIKVEVICPEYLRNTIAEELLLQTTTLGVRYYSAKRNTLQRSKAEIQTELGPIQVKLSIQNDGSKKYLPEYDVCRSIALKKNIPIKKVYDIIAKTTFNI